MGGEVKNPVVPTVEQLRRELIGESENIIIGIIDQMLRENKQHLHVQSGLTRAREGLGRICEQLRGMIEFTSQTSSGGQRKESRVSEDRRR